VGQGHNAAASLNSNLRADMIHEFRFNYLVNALSNAPYLLGTDFNKEAGITGLEETKIPGNAGSFPDFSWSGYSAIQVRPSTSVLRLRTGRPTS